MTELKTLKDFEGIDCGCCARTALSPDELKAEAVKDIKAVENGDLVPDDTKEYIMWKFNLTEEDLEEKS